MKVRESENDLPHLVFTSSSPSHPGKPCITDTAEECRRCLNARIAMIGKKVQDSVWGDPPNFLRPIVGLSVPHHHLVDPLLPAAPAASSVRSFHTSTYWHGPSPVEPSLGSSFHAMAKLAGAAPPPPTPPSSATKPFSPSTDKGSDVQRINIGVFGVMNAGR